MAVGLNGLQAGEHTMKAAKVVLLSSSSFSSPAAAPHVNKHNLTLPNNKEDAQCVCVCSKRIHIRVALNLQSDWQFVADSLLLAGEGRWGWLNTEGRALRLSVSLRYSGHWSLPRTDLCIRL